MAFAANRFASGGSDNYVHLTDLRSNSASVLSGHHGEIAGLSWSPDGVQLASGGCDNRVIVWGKEKHRSLEFQSPIQGLTWMNSGVLAVGDSDSTGNLTLVSLRSETAPMTVSTGAAISGLIFSDRWGIIMSHKHENYKWEIWNTDLKRVSSYNGHTNDILNIAGTNDGSFTATIATDETLQIWEMRDGKARTPTTKISHNGLPPGLLLR
jgi:WD40 repeat protein